MSTEGALENEPMFGWFVCRFDKKQIHSILYGQFSRKALPPSSGWVFLARDAAEEQTENDIVKMSHEGIVLYVIFIRF